MTQRTNKTTENKFRKLTELSKTELLKIGIRKFNFEKVISSCGLSKATVYKKFKNKKEFIRHIIKQLFIDLTGPFEDYISDLNSLESIIDKILNAAENLDKIMIKYHFADVINSEEITSLINDLYYETFGKVILKKISQLQQLHEIRSDIDEDIILEFVTSVTKGLSKLMSVKSFEKTGLSYRKLLISALKDGFND